MCRTRESAGEGRSPAVLGRQAGTEQKEYTGMGHNLHPGKEVGKCVRVAVQCSVWCRSGKCLPGIVGEGGRRATPVLSIHQTERHGEGYDIQVKSLLCRQKVRQQTMDISEPI